MTTSAAPPDPLSPAHTERLLSALRAMQARLRQRIHSQMRETGGGTGPTVAHEAPSDIIYSIDKVCDDLLVELLSELAREIPILLIAEGVNEDQPLPLPIGTAPENCLFRVIVDPIDGTRMLMYDKRSAWTLAGVAPNRGEETNLQDIFLAVMTELPTTKQNLGDVMWAVKGQGCQGWRENLDDGSRRAWRPTPSQAGSLDHGFAQITKFFPGRKPFAAHIEETLFRRLNLHGQDNRCLVFDDQYLSTGGQIYELLAGHDRFQADIRAAMRAFVDADNPPPGMACHPYDICTALIAQESGIIVEDIHGKPLSSPLDTTSEVDWMAYANPAIHAMVARAIRDIFHQTGLIAT